MLIICCSESLWRMAFFTTAERMKGNWQKENLKAPVTQHKDFRPDRLRNPQVGKTELTDADSLTKKY